MPRFTKYGLTIETSLATEAAELRRDGFKEQKARTAAVKEADAAKVDDSAKAVNGTPAGDAPKPTK